MLHYANRDIPFLGKEAFYEIKKEMLKKYGRPIGTDYQHIVKECYTCDASGIFTSDYKLPEPCWKCYGTGVFSETVIHLVKYRFGKHEFHIPYHRVQIFKKSDLPNVTFIEGYIRHKAPRFHIGLECSLWILMFYNFKVFKKCIRSSRRFNIRTPLVALQATIFFFRHQLPSNINRFVRKLKPKAKQNIQFINDDELPF